MDRTNRRPSLALAHNLVLLFRVFSILTVLWTLVEVLVQLAAADVMHHGTGVGTLAEGLWAALEVLIHGLWLAALDLAIAEGLSILLNMEARGHRAAQEGPPGGQAHQGAGSPFSTGGGERLAGQEAM